jgi:hypothetical protein
MSILLLRLPPRSFSYYLLSLTTEILRIPIEKYLVSPFQGLLCLFILIGVVRCLLIKNTYRKIRLDFQKNRQSFYSRVLTLSHYFSLLLSCIPESQVFLIPKFWMRTFLSLSSNPEKHKFFYSKVLTLSRNFSTPRPRSGLESRFLSLNSNPE